MSMKFRAHDTFFIRKGWLGKGMKNVRKSPDVFMSKSENPTDVLGIGANMVKALRYWLPAVGLTEESRRGRKGQYFTELGELIYHHDRYMEELGTLFLLHYKLASNPQEATSWYFFFNEFSMSEFTKEDFVNLLQNYAVMHHEDVAIRSLNDDFTCIINTYLPRYKTNPERISPENNIDCPFGELGLIDIVNKKSKIYRKTVPMASSVDPWVAMAVIADQAKNRKEIPMNELLHAPNNIGRIFNLDSITLLDVLHRIEKMGTIKIVRTAGLDLIQILRPYTFLACVEEYYRTIERVE